MRKYIVYLVLCVLALSACKKTDVVVDETELVQALQSEATTDYSLYKDLVTLPDKYVGIEVPPITEEEKQDYINSILESYTELKEVSKTAENGNVVNISYTGYIDGVAVQEYTAEGVDVLLGSEAFIADFEEQLIGCSAGDKKKISVTYPDDYFLTEVSGVTVSFDVTVNKVQETIKRTLDVEFVKEYTEGDITTVEAFLEYINEYLFNAKKVETVLAYIDEHSVVKSINMTYVENDLANTKSYCEAYAATYGISVDEFVQLFYGYTNLDEYLAILKEELILSERQRAVLYTIADKESLTVAEDRAVKLASEYGFNTLDEFYEEYGKVFVTQSLLMEAAMEFLVNNAF